MSLVAQEVRHLDLIGQPQLQVHEVALDLLRNESHRGSDDREFALVETGLVEVPKAASNLRIFTHRFMKVLQMEDRRILVSDDEVQSCARGKSLGGVGVLATHALGETPGPNRHGRGVE